ncbi:MAG: hypothetical protein ACXACY_05445 [Candidatus Hodarchaeales archaeon]
MQFKVPANLQDSIIHILNKGTCNIRETIVVSGSPRSGTSWLGPLIGRAPGYCYSHEPLQLKQFPGGKRVGLEWRTHIHPDESKSEIEDYMGKVLTGQIGKPRPVDGGGFISILKNRKLVVKFVRANRMLGWLNRRFPSKAIVVILRHPCAVVSSQITMGEGDKGPWKNVTPPEQDTIQSHFGGRIPDEAVEKFGDLLKSIETREGTLAATWCLDHYFLFNHYLNSKTLKTCPWIFTSYESLLEEGLDEFKRIYSEIGIDVPYNLEGYMKKPSNVSSSDLNLINLERQLSKWKDKLTDEQIDEILGIVKEFKLDFYTEDTRPNINQLNKLISI